MKYRKKAYTHAHRTQITTATNKAATGSKAEKENGIQKNRRRKNCVVDYDDDDDNDDKIRTITRKSVLLEATNKLR
ncbi:MAG: hypothetical protein EOO43_15690 [Flavobacterium sp.]|nr:MAG: hypothetical protein EOO43_15690 [Flavobacterium sp.]